MSTSGMHRRPLKGRHLVNFEVFQIKFSENKVPLKKMSFIL